jgi:hypothetical protein
LNGFSVIPASEVHTVRVFGFVDNREVGWAKMGGLEWHDIHSQFCKNKSVSVYNMKVSRKLRAV